MSKLQLNDFHCWNKTKTPCIIDNVNDIKYHYDMIAQIRLKTNNYDIVYKEWNNIPKHILKNIQLIISLLTKQTKQEIQTTYNNIKSVPNNCLTLSVYRKKMIDVEIAVGSLGLKSKITGKIWWEYGNGRSNWEDDVIQYTTE